jgi:hypothetical protein
MYVQSGSTVVPPPGWHLSTAPPSAPSVAHAVCTGDVYEVQVVPSTVVAHVEYVVLSAQSSHSSPSQPSMFSSAAAQAGPFFVSVSWMQPA